MRKRAYLLNVILLLVYLSSFGQNEKRVVVISGGGARGAWGAGLLTGIINSQQPDYRAAFGTSTGSLMAALVINNDTLPLRMAYTTTTQKEIFSNNPFRKNGDIKMLKAGWRVITGKPNLGETQALRKLVDHYISMDILNNLKKNGKSFTVSVVSLSKNRVDFKNSDVVCMGNSWSEKERENMVDWIWASADQPAFMTAVKKDGEEWVDGGVKENVPIKEAAEYARAHDIKAMDIVVNNVQTEKKTPWPPAGKKDNIIQKLLRTIDIFSDEVRLNDIVDGLRAAHVEGDSLTVNIYFMNQKEFDRCPNSLFFEPDRMKDLWKWGFVRTSGAAAVVPPSFINIGNTLLKVF